MNDKWQWDIFNIGFGSLILITIAWIIILIVEG